MGVVSPKHATLAVGSIRRDREVMNRIDNLCYAIVVLTLISTLVGICYSTGGSQFTVENIYQFRKSTPSVL